MRIAICEDTQADRSLLIGFCEKYARLRSISLETVLFENADLLLEDERVMDMDALFMDIHMGSITTGVDAAHALRQKGYDGALCFVTVSKDFVAEGFEVGALHYLIKPVTYEAFDEAMNRAARTLGTLERHITIMSNRREIDIPLRHILYVSVEKHKTYIYTSAGKVPVNMSLHEIESLLSDARFLKCYRSCIVNMEQVARVEENDFLMKSGERVPFTQRQAAHIKDCYMRYIFSIGKPNGKDERDER